MNLSPLWVPFFAQHGWEAVHWSTVGVPQASDETLMAWADLHEHVVFTHDLDFGTILPVTRAAGPSVLQVRTNHVLPEQLGTLVLEVLAQFQPLLTSGALITVDEQNARARVLPIR